MFLKCNRRMKDGKTHCYWNVVESRRLSDGRVVQRQVLYLGEINDSQREAWRKTIEVFDEGSRRQVALFAEGAMPENDAQAVGIRLNELQLKHPRQWGACWLSVILWQQLQLNEFWHTRLRPSRKGTQWLKVLQTLVAYRLIDPGSEWRLHRHWYDANAMSDLLDADFALAQKDTLYRCLDKLVVHKDELFKFLRARWGELFGARFDVLLFDLTSTYFESDLTGHDPDQLWTFYVQLTEVEQAFKELKHDLAVRPIHHQIESRIEAHIFVAFLAYCLQVTLKAQLKPLAKGLTPREVLDQFKTIQMVDVHVPTTDGRQLVLSRYTQPEPEHRVLLDLLRLTLPAQPPPKITARQVRHSPEPSLV